MCDDMCCCDGMCCCGDMCHCNCTERCIVCSDICVKDSNKMTKACSDFGMIVMACLYVSIPWVIIGSENYTGSFDSVEAISVSSSAIAGIVILLIAFSMLSHGDKRCVRCLLTLSLLALWGLCAALLVIPIVGTCSEGSRGCRLAEVVPTTYLPLLVLASAWYLYGCCMSMTARVVSARPSTAPNFHLHEEHTVHV
jgi:hypothetical protein